jgi:hypothetical protein
LGCFRFKLFILWVELYAEDEGIDLIKSESISEHSESMSPNLEID